MNKVPVDNGLLSVSERQIRPLYIEGYTHQLSYLPGDQIEFHISTSASQYSLEIARVGADYEVVWQEKIYLEPPIQPRKTPLRTVATGLLVLHSACLIPGKADTVWLRCE